MLAESRVATRRRTFVVSLLAYLAFETVATSSNPPRFRAAQFPRGGNADSGSQEEISTTPQQEGEASRAMYNAQATKWVRTEPRCLSDFTGRPVVFSFLEPHIPGATVLDVGCGEGYCARKVLEMGAERVIGSDISEEMVRSASATAAAMGQGDALSFYAAPCSELLAGLAVKKEGLGIGGDSVEGSMDVAIAVFLFNYLTSGEMEDAMRQIHTALKPGGVFVFSVPHPSMIYSHGGDDDASFSAFRLKTKGKGYFSSRNEKILGTICTINKEELNVMSVHKTINDYMSAINSVGFEIVDIREAGVTEEHMQLNPAFFGSVEDRALHLVFKLRKRQLEQSY